MSQSPAETSKDPAFLQKQLEIARREIHNLRQQIISLNHVHKKECDSIYQKLKDWQCLTCRARQSTHVTTDSNDESQYDFKYNYIGHIITQFPEKRGTPRQPGICPDMVAKLVLNNEVFTNPKHALEGLQEFSHMWILFHFHCNDSNHVRAKVAPPRLNGIRTGVFATRSPHRPCPIGLSLVKIDRVMENVIYFSGVDMINETPVLDIKPYIPQYDNPGLTNMHLPETNESEDSQSESTTDNTDNFIEVDTRNVPSTSNFSDVVTGVDALNINGRVLDGEENEQTDAIMNLNISEPFFTRSTSRIGEREAPDGEEEENPRTIPINSTVPIPNTPDGEVRVASWVNQAPVSRLNVMFKERALYQLSQLGSEGEEKKTTITNVLREDPRSIYLRERWGSHCYVFRIADLCVSCKFNDTNHSVTVYQVFENEAPNND
ncbi:tRNA (adenine(37)-N6)-methyltransferase isoform X1 [Aethina tumida]|uniref:tRNA (adenine(37)-N6)-methyltransferase isoform X1 n=1 Tax=Aethina tumida TaxID=116153 RepID=UPI0021493D65|nr:tRNA (adenine(37)-N6)-methyltransferase isoform X1 [Aethina tumida]